MNRFDIIDKLNSKVDDLIEYTKLSALIKKEDDKRVLTAVFCVALVVLVAVLAICVYSLVKKKTQDIYFEDEYDDMLDEDEFEDELDEEAEI